MATMLDLMERELAIPRTRGARARERRRRPARDADREPGEGRPRHTARVSYEFKLPDLGEGLTEGEIARWLVSEGQEIAEDDPLVEIATDKTTVEIPSPAAGTVAKIFVGEGEIVPVGTVLVVIGGDQRPEPGTASRSQVPVRATPLVRRLAQELGVDLDSRSRARGRRGASPSRTCAAARRREEGRREPIRGIKRQMFEHLTHAHAVPTSRGSRSATSPASTSSCSSRSCSRRAPSRCASSRSSTRASRTASSCTSTATTSASLCRPSRASSCPSSADATRARSTSSTPTSAGSPKPRSAGTLAPEELRDGTFTVTSAGRSAGLFVDAAAQPSGGGDPRRPSHRGPRRRARRRDRRAPDGERLGDVRPPRHRRQARGRLRPRRHRPPAAVATPRRGGASRASPRCAASSRGRRCGRRRAGP